MCKYFNIVELEPEVRRLLIGEFGSVAKAKDDMSIFTHHLPENLQEQIVEYANAKYPYLAKNPVTYKECFQELNQNIKMILGSLYQSA